MYIDDNFAEYCKRLNIIQARQKFQHGICGESLLMLLGIIKLQNKNIEKVHLVGFKKARNTSRSVISHYYPTILSGLIVYTQGKLVQYQLVKYCKLEICKDQNCEFHNIRSLNTSSYTHGEIIIYGRYLIEIPEITWIRYSTKLSLVQSVIMAEELIREGVFNTDICYNFVKENQGYYGTRFTKLYLQYITGKSDSIMESMMYQILTLPKLRGGYGITKYHQGYKIEIPYEIKRKYNLNTKYFVMDGCFPSVKLVLEYQGENAHFGVNETQNSYSVKREQILKSLGYDILYVTKETLKNPNMLYDLVKYICISLGKKIPQKPTRLISYSELNLFWN